jgi:hypothetical protein
MNGPIAQIVALTCHGNAILSGQPGLPFLPANSTCQFSERVTFVTLGKSLLGKLNETKLADSPEAWFSHLKACEALGIRLWRAPQNNPGLSDRMSAGLVGGGGTWTMEILLPGDTSEQWVARWEVGSRDAPDQRIWRVTYGRVSKGKSNHAKVCELPEAIHALEESLKEVRAFSAKQKLEVFRKRFEEALDTIETKGRNRHGYHQDLAPTGFLLEEAAVLLDACQTAWVFGGMGSWNDLWFEGEDQGIYERVSERLFEAVNAGIEQAATSSRRFLL